MARGRNGEVCWVMWIGKRQWEGLSGEFDVGQTGWAWPKDESAGFFDFFPAFDPKIAWSYQVACVVEDFLRFTLHENA